MINDFKMDFVDWINYGMDMGWCTEIYCDTHDGRMFTDEEAKQWDDGEDPCIPVVRIW